MIKKLQVSSKLGWEIPPHTTYFSQSICRRASFFFFPPKTRCFGQKLTPPPCGVTPYWSCHIESRLTGLTIHSKCVTGQCCRKVWKFGGGRGGGSSNMDTYSFPPGWDRVNWFVKTLGAMPPFALPAPTALQQNRRSGNELQTVSLARKRWILFSSFIP
jgi:hypothetical protein